MTSKSSYAQILKASSIMGGAAGINLLLGMLRVKFAAVFIGTTGVGLISSFGALQGLVGTLAGLGIQSSAVREIAAAVGKGDEQAVGRAVLALRRICWLTGLVGMAAMMLLAPLLSQLTQLQEQLAFHDDVDFWRSHLISILTNNALSGCFNAHFIVRGCLLARVVALRHKPRKRRLGCVGDGGCWTALFAAGAAPTGGYGAGWFV